MLAHLCIAIFGLMYCELYMKGREKKDNTCGSYIRKYGMLLFIYHGEGYVKCALLIENIFTYKKF